MDTEEQIQFDDQAEQKAQEPARASTNSIAYLADLIDKKDFTGARAELPQAWQELFDRFARSSCVKRPDQIHAGGFYAQADVSKFIDMLKACPKRPFGLAANEMIESKVLSQAGGGWPSTEETEAVARDRKHYGDPVSTQGIYKVNARGGETKIYKVYPNQTGERLLAKLLVTDGVDQNEWVYQGMAHRFVRAADKITMAEALKYGRITGICVCCGRTLTNELSVALGIGPICGGREFGGEYKLLVDTAETIGANTAIALLIDETTNIDQTATESRASNV